MMIKVSAHLQTFGNNIYTRKSSPKNIYLFKVNNSDTEKSVKQLTKMLAQMTPERERLSIAFIVNFEHI